MPATVAAEAGAGTTLRAANADADADAVAAEAEAVDECPASEAADTVDCFAGRTLLGTVAEGAGAGA